MKRIICSLLAFAMIMTVFAGVVIFNASANAASATVGNFDSSDIIATFGAAADPEVVKNDGAVKLLMIGNSFSVNAYTFIRQIAASAGVNLVVANLNYGGCSLQQHADFMTNNKTVYGYQRSWGDNISNYTASQALNDQDWDFISIQQVSGKAGRPETYQPYMHTVIEYIKQRCPNAEIIWHQTWAYQKTSDHSDFPYFNKDQDYMWQCIESTSKQMTAEEGIRYIVPSGKAFQNARATAIGDNLNTDGYHANDMGCYLAGYCFFSTVTGNLPSTTSYRPTSIDEASWKLLRRAVTDAVTEYGYVSYNESGVYIPAIEKMRDSAGSIDGLMLAGNLAAKSTDGLASLKAINNDYLGNNNVMFTVGEGDRALSSNAPLLYTTLLKEYYTNDLEPAAQKRKGNRHIKVNGIDIIGITYDKLTDGFAVYTDAALEWLDTELNAIQGNMPVFVVTSFPVTHTADSRGASRICDILKKHPNVIAFAGGTHAGVSADYVMHYDGFTAVNVGSLSDETSTGLMVDVDSNGNVRIRRFDFTNDLEYDPLYVNADGSGSGEYANGYYEAPDVYVAEGEYDVDNAPAMTWLQDGEKATLDGEPCEYGSVITAPGEHTLVVTAGDKSTSVTFTIIDDTPEPVVSIADGAEFKTSELGNGPLVITWTPEEATATLNGEEYTHTFIEEPGEYVLVVTNGTKSVTINFTIVDDTPEPVLSIADGAEFSIPGEPACVTWTPESATGTLNGEEYLSGTVITEVGEYTLTVVNGSKSVTVNFTIVDNFMTPEVSVADGTEFKLSDFAEGPLVITWLPEEATATLNGEEYAHTFIGAPGEYVLVVTNGTKSVTVNFTIVDDTPEPVISIADGAEFDLYIAEEPIAATWTPEGTTGTLNGEEYIAGTEITEVGEYTLTVVNGSKSVTVSFTIVDTTPAPVQKKGDFDGDDAITVADALAALRIAAKLAEETPEMIEIGDTDGDGHVTVADALAILRVAAKLASEDSLK